ASIDGGYADEVVETAREEATGTKTAGASFGGLVSGQVDKQTASEHVTSLHKKITPAALFDRIYRDYTPLHLNTQHPTEMVKNLNRRTRVEADVVVSLSGFSSMIDMMRSLAPLLAAPGELGSEVTNAIREFGERSFFIFMEPQE